MQKKVQPIQLMTNMLDDNMDSDALFLTSKVSDQERPQGDPPLHENNFE